MHTPILMTGLFLSSLEDMITGSNVAAATTKAITITITTLFLILIPPAHRI
jgi:hypothetical protein